MGGHVKSGHHKLHISHIVVVHRTSKLDKSTVIYLLLLAYVTQLYIVYGPKCWSVCLVIYYNIVYILIEKYLSQKKCIVIETRLP